MLRELTFSTSPRCWIMASRMSSRSYSNGILSRTFSNCSATAWLLLIAGLYFFSSVVIPFATFFQLKHERAADRVRLRRTQFFRRHFVLGYTTPSRPLGGTARPHNRGVLPRKTSVRAQRVVHLPEDVLRNPLLAALGEGRILQHFGQRALDRLLYLRFDAGLRRVVKRSVPLGLQCPSLDVELLAFLLDGLPFGIDPAPGRTAAAGNASVLRPAHQRLDQALQPLAIVLGKRLAEKVHALVEPLRLERRKEHAFGKLL